MNAIIHNLGYPRIGADRELKKALEAYWSGKTKLADLRSVGQSILRENRKSQEGLDILTVGDFSYYDHMLDASLLFGNVPRRFRGLDAEVPLDVVIPRGTHADGVRIEASEMMKWFNTNYHYIVPEFDPDTEFSLHPRALLSGVETGRTYGKPMKAVLPGPLTYLWMGKERTEGFSRLDLLPRLIPRYGELMERLRQAGVEWVQLDEPILVLDYLPREWKEGFSHAYEYLAGARKGGGPKILLTTYFDDIEENFSLAAGLPVDGIHLDLTAGGMKDRFRKLAARLEELPGPSVVSLGVVDGRNVRKADLRFIHDEILRLEPLLRDRLWLAPSCSLLHVPVSLEAETELPGEIRARLSFAREKLGELELLKAVLAGKMEPSALGDVRYGAERGGRESFSRQPAVSPATSSVQPGGSAVEYCGSDVPAKTRRTPYAVRAKVQKEKLGLPLLPTTTIGSFPQTPELRKARTDYGRGRIGAAEYEAVIRSYIDRVMEAQESYGFDVLVHGEPERNDMVEYFADFLEGFVRTRNGWVQSYGSRCVKPPIIWGNVSRKSSMTLRWLEHARSRTGKPVKGMLTGPVTIMKWSFPRDDIPVSEQSMQIAQAVAEEVLELEAAGFSIIQIDEAAFKEAQPLKKRDWEHYAAWSSLAFRLCSVDVRDSTQIHTHMCYSDFSMILEAVKAMDADVITIETSRSEMELLRSVTGTGGFNEFGPGIYDIHSPEVPDVSTLRGRILKALEVLPADRLWINPDCGLKTREWPEVEASLRNLTAAAREVREAFLTQPAGGPA